jgi:Fe-S cluster assembly protein SufD
VHGPHWRFRKGLDLPLHTDTFSAQASAGLPGPAWLRERRAAAYEAVTTSALPSESEEVWRYTPINSLVLDDFAPPAHDGPAPAGDQLLSTLTTALGAVAGSVLVHNGRASTFNVSGGDGTGATGLAFGGADDVPGSSVMLGSVQEGGDALVRLNDAFAPDPVFVDVADGAQVDAPVLIVHWCDATSAFPRTAVRAGAGSAVSVVEVFAGPGAGAGAGAGARSLVVPVTELAAGDGASLSYVSLQILDGAAWAIARLAGRGAANSSLRTFTVGLGASYDRVRADVSVEGKDARSEILSAYLGHGTQIHDIRTLQDHVAPRTTSELLCQGAVAGTSRSVYSGLIRVHRGAVRSDARQTNHNLVLDEGAHADSVPNLDILENDVRCSHASTVGPVDEDQRYYIESRGVAPEMAEGLIVRGFFDAIIDRSPVPEVIPFLQREVHDRLDVALGGRALPAGV